MYKRLATTMVFNMAIFNITVALSGGGGGGGKLHFRTHSKRLQGLQFHIVHFHINLFFLYLCTIANTAIDCQENESQLAMFSALLTMRKFKLLPKLLLLFVLKLPYSYLKERVQNCG